MEPPFKDQLVAAFKALSGKDNIEAVTAEHSGDRPFLPPATYRRDENIALLPVYAVDSDEHRAKARGEADALALWIAHHDDAVHESWQSRLQDSALLDRLEQTRVEALGADYRAGVAENLHARWDASLKLHGYDKQKHIKDMPTEELLSLLLFQKITGAAPKAAELALSTVGAMMGEQYKTLISQLAHKRHDQEAFAELIEKLIIRLEQHEREGQETEDDEQPTVSRSSPQQEETDDGESEVQSVASQEQGADADASQTPMAGQSVLSDDEKEGSEDKSEGRAASPHPQRNVHMLPLPYKIFTTSHDRIAGAKELADREELAELRRQLDKRLHDLRDVTRKLTIKLQRHLLSTQLHQWDFNMEEGILDSNKLPAVIIDPAYAAPYKWERTTPYANTVVSLLIDNSGSMRGRPITMAALCADILAQTLERCQVKVEILGFTTQQWKGGQSRKDWMEAGSPENPGRLNDLLHIVYKSANTPYRAGKNNLGLMLKDGLLKENIDGEALLWAHDRLLNRPEERKILMVISDGAPVDDSTLSTNQGDYLDSHLRQVIDGIEHHSPADLLAIGIGHDVTGYYEHSVMIQHIEKLGDAMINQLASLFDSQNMLQKKKLRAKTR